MNTAQVPRFRISPNGLTIGTKTLISPFDAEWFSRTVRLKPKVCLLHEDPDFLAIWVFDEIGIYIRCDRQTKATSTITFTFHKESYVFSPEKQFPGVLEMNDVLLDGSMTEKTLPLQGQFGLKKAIGKSYSAESGPFSVSLRLKRLRAGKPKLTAVEFAFAAADLPPKVIAERLARH